MYKRICQFGIFKPEYIRNKVLSLGFEKNGYEVVQIAVDPSVGSFKKFIELYKAYKKLDNKKFDYVIVSYPGHTVVWLARLLFGKNIIFDAFLSLYDANVQDRKLYGSWSPMGRWNWFLDWHACKLAKKVLLPEKVHVDYFVKTFGIPKSKFVQIYTGANNAVFMPVPETPKLPKFTASFHGNFIPLQGIEFIIDAANILKDKEVEFQIIGSGGELYENIQKKISDLGLTNVHMLGRKPLEEIPSLIAQAHVCLGVFGDTEKTKRVVSNKIYEGIATGAPMVTSRTPATEELFTDGENALLVNVADGSDLAEKLLVLKEDEELRQRIAEGGYKLFTEHLTPEKLVAKLVKDLA